MLWWNHLHANFLHFSAFPSAAAEAESGDFKPHSALVNKEEDRRPGSVEPEKMIADSTVINQVKQAPWEKRRDGKSWM